MPSPRIVTLAYRPFHSDDLSNADAILRKTHDSVSNFFQTEEIIRSSRRGTLTDEEQDLLRAMLIFASAGLDQLVKQLIKDVLPRVMDANQESQANLEKYISRKLKKSGQASEDRFSEILDVKLLSKALASKNPRDAIIKGLVNELVGDSLQSVDQLVKVTEFFAIPTDEITVDLKALTVVFGVRNEIIHEMDIDLLARNRNRRIRTISNMVSYTNSILKIAENFLIAVDKRL